MSETTLRRDRPTGGLSGGEPLPGWVRFLLAVLPVMAASALGSVATMPAIPVWYEGLVKPPHNPPNWVFGPVWTLLYIMMALAVWRILALRPGLPGRREALIAFFAQLTVNAAWSWAFFGMHSPLAGLIVIVVLLIGIVETIRRFWPLDRIAAGLLVPYLAWVGFASTVNAGVWWLNR